MVTKLTPPSAQDSSKHLPPLILIHGYPFDHTMWKAVTHELHGRTKIMAPDLPGFGDNPVENAEPSIDLMADAVAKFLDLHNVRQAVIAGMSMGGYVALAFAERHPGRMAGLALISTQPGADSDEVKEARRSLAAKVRRAGPGVAAEALLPKLFSEQNHTEELARHPINGAEKAGVDGITWALEAMAQRPDRTPLLRTLQVPSVVLHGASDKIIPVERARQMAGLMSDGRYVELAEAGHATPLENPKAVADALLELLERANRSLHQSPKRDERANRLPGVTWSPSDRGL